MFRSAAKAILLTAMAWALALPAAAQQTISTASDPEMVAAAPSNQYAVAAGDYAAPAVAQINDAADAAQAKQKIALYKQLMELNGTSRNLRNVIAATKSATRLIVIDRAKVDKLSAVQETRYNQIADQILGQTQNDLIQSIAEAQAPAFSTDEIRQLITANASIAAAKYTAAKFTSSDATTNEIQTYMVEAVIKIVKTFTTSQAS